MLPELSLSEVSLEDMFKLIPIIYSGRNQDILFPVEPSLARLLEACCVSHHIRI